MIKRINAILIIFVLFLTACSVTSGKFHNIKLSDNSTIQDANAIVRTILQSQLETKTIKEFPNWNPQKHIMYVRASNVMDTDNPSNTGIYITVGVKCNLKNIDEILNYLKSEVEKEINRYFKNQDL